MHVEHDGIETSRCYCNAQLDVVQTTYFLDFRSWELAQTTHDVTDHPATRFGSVYFVDITNCA